jgi:hypothetical protein
MRGGGGIDVFLSLPFAMRFSPPDSLLPVLNFVVEFYSTIYSGMN